MNELILNKPFELKKTALIVNGKPKIDEWIEAGEKLKSIEGSIQWWLGDWLNYGESAYGEMYSQALDATDYEYQTLKDAKWVANKIEMSLRKDNLSFNHHKQVAKLSKEKLIHYLDIAEKDGLSVRELKNRILENQKTEILPLPPGKFRVTVCDPPWPYGTEYDADTRRVASPYLEMSLENITNQKPEFADPSVLWLWTTHKFLPVSFDLLKKWGFDYKLTFVWNKEKMGMGAWLRCQVEFCLLGVKGKPQWNLTNQRDILSEKRREHSRKPESFYEIIEELCPGPLDETFYLEMYQRYLRKGWKGWGNERRKV